MIICAASSEEKYNAVGTYSCTQRQEFSKLHFHVTSMVVSASAFTNTSVSFFFSSFTADFDKGSQILFEDRAAMVLVCSHIFT